MNLTPEQKKRIIEATPGAGLPAIPPETDDEGRRRSIGEHYRGTMREKIARARGELDAVRVAIRQAATDIGGQLSQLFDKAKELERRIDAMSADLCQSDDTTALLPIQKPEDQQTTQRLKRG